MSNVFKESIYISSIQEIDDHQPTIQDEAHDVYGGDDYDDQWEIDFVDPAYEGGDEWE